MCYECRCSQSEMAHLQELDRQHYEERKAWEQRQEDEYFGWLYVWDFIWGIDSNPSLSLDEGNDHAQK